MGDEAKRLRMVGRNVFIGVMQGVCVTILLPVMVWLAYLWVYANWVQWFPPGY